MGCSKGQDDLLKFKLSIRLRKKGDLSDFKCGMVVGATRVGLSISERADLLVFSHRWSEKLHVG